MKVTLAILSIFLFSEITSFKCGSHYYSQNEIKIINPIKKDKNYRNLQSTSHPIKIYIDFEILENLVKNGNITKEYYTNLTLGLNSSINYLNKLIFVNGPQSIYIESYYFPFSNGSIIQSDIPKLINNEINADLILIPKISFNDDGSHGGSYIISLNQNDKRPIIGGIILKTHYNFAKTNSQFFIVMFLLHEITHILGFESSLFPYFNSGSQLITKNINGVEKKLFTGKNVIKYAKKHFGCDNIDGIELENQIGGTHWESRIMLSDYMIGFDYSEIVISEISLALLEDSGWYKINYYTGGLFRYGKGEGCDFLFNKCVTKGNVNFKKEFCIKNGERKCTAGHLSRGKCYMKRQFSQFEKYYQYYDDPLYGGLRYTDYCPVPEDEYYLFYYNNFCDSNSRRNNYPSEFGEKYSENSICIESSLVPNNFLNSNYDIEKRTMCHEIKCDFQSNTFLIYLADTFIKCPGYYAEINVEGYAGSIFCPDFNRVCTGSFWCINPLNCIDKKSKNVAFNDLSENEEEENIGEMKSIEYEENIISEYENDYNYFEEYDEIEDNNEFENINLFEEEFEEEEINLEEEEFEELYEYEEDEQNNLYEEDEFDKIYQNINEENKNEEELNNTKEYEEEENNIILDEEEELKYNEEEEGNNIILDIDNNELEEENEYYDEEEELESNEEEEEEEGNNHEKENDYYEEQNKNNEDKEIKEIEEINEYEEEERNIIEYEENIELKDINQYEEEENNLIFDEDEEEGLEYDENDDENYNILEQDLDKINENEENYNSIDKEIIEEDEEEESKNKSKFIKTEEENNESENDIKNIKGKDKIDMSDEEKETNNKEEKNDLYNEKIIDEENSNINNEKTKENIDEIKDNIEEKTKEKEEGSKNDTSNQSNLIKISFPVLIILLICLII